MKRFLTALALALALSFQAYSAQSSATIEGVVLEVGTDKPIAGAHVKLFGESLPRFNSEELQNFGDSVTDAEGRFILKAAKAGRYRVVPIKDGLVFVHPRPLQIPREPGTWIQVGEGQRIQNVQFRMQRESAISGVLVDSKGNPFIGPLGSAALRVHWYDDFGKRTLDGVPGVSYPNAAYSFVRTNDRGEFRLYGLPAGDYFVSVSGSGAAGGYLPGLTDEAHATPIHVASGDEVRLGTIVLPPAPRTSVTLHFKRDGIPVVMPRPAVTGSFGSLLSWNSQPEFVFSLPAGRHDLLISTQDFGRGDLLYAQVSLNVGTDAIEQDVEVKKGVSVKTNLVVDGKLWVPNQFNPTCRLTAETSSRTATCVAGATVIPDSYRLVEMVNLSPEQYVKSVRSGAIDVLADGGLKITGDTELDIQVGSMGAVLEGDVTDAGGNKVPHGVVALVPDAPYRSAGIWYRSGPSDINGHFELRGIAPGAYHLFAWTELPLGAPYRNPEFMKPYEERGKAVRIEKTERTSVDVRLPIP